MSAPKGVRVVPEGVARFDEKKLPDIALLDTTVWLRALTWADDDGGSCEAFVEAMLHHEKRVLMSAATVAELLRGDASRKIPNRRGIVPVAFDVTAGELLGRIAPKAWLSQFPKGERTFIKFDALIVACAKRWNASCVVSIDGKATMRKVAEAAKIDLVRPDHFLLPLEAGLARADELEAAALAEKRAREAKY